jgi:hypothetical protein
MNNIIFRNGKGKVVAKTIHNDQILYKRASKSIHMLRSPLGWAFDKAILEQCQTIQVKEVWIEDKESGWIYKAPLQSFFDKGMTIERGHGTQICLPLLEWSHSLVRD